ncbi:hypothetical protein FRX31_022216, partial [Thalictrum thalictroides]
MKEGVRDEATQQRINEVVRIMKLYQKGRKPSEVEEEFLKEESKWLKENEFNFGLGLLMDGVPIEKECDNAYAQYLIMFGLPREEEESIIRSPRDGGEVTTAQSSSGSGSSTAKSAKKKRKGSKVETK